MLDAIVDDKPVGPHGATFEDGYRCSMICDAIVGSSRSRRYVDITYCAILPAFSFPTPA